MSWHPPLQCRKRKKRGYEEGWHPPLQCRRRMRSEDQKQFVAKQKSQGFWWNRTWELYCLIGKLVHRSCWWQHLYRGMVLHEIKISTILWNLHNCKKFTIPKKEINDVKAMLAKPEMPPYVKLPGCWTPPANKCVTVIKDGQLFGKIWDKLKKVKAKFVALNMEYDCYVELNKEARGGHLLILGFYEFIEGGDKVPHIYLIQHPRKNKLKILYRHIIRNHKDLAFVVYGNGYSDIGVDLKELKGMKLKQMQPHIGALGLDDACYSLHGIPMDRGSSFIDWSNKDLLEHQIDHCCGGVLIPLDIAYYENVTSWKTYCPKMFDEDKLQSREEMRY